MGANFVRDGGDALLAAILRAPMKPDRDALLASILFSPSKWQLEPKQPHSRHTFTAPQHIC
eukprot:2159004-Amphidinium_carterae.1